MTFGVRFLGLITLLGLVMQSAALAQCVSLTTTGSAVSQNFDTLATTGVNNNLTITGWFLDETGGGTRDNEQYGADTGSSNTADTYSYGAAAASERALGGLQSGTLIPTFGACFTNNTGVTLGSLRVDYTGEQWRLGVAARTDQIDFQYSTNATSLVTGSWTDVNALDFVTPFTATAGARDGNLAANRTALTHTIPGLSIANGATFWIRWTDFNVSGADDGLAVDDFSLTPFADPCASIAFPYTLPNFAPATLITAMECANANGPSADSIDLAGQTIALTGAYADYTGATGLPQVNTAITLQNGTIARSGASQFRLLAVGLSGNLTLNNVTAGNGHGLAPGNMGGGGAIYNLGALNIVGGRFISNFSALDGGAIHNDGGAVNARDTVFSGNSVNTAIGGVGGGLANSFGVVTLSNVLISGNLAVQGAGIYNNNGGTLTLNNSTIAGNSTNDQGAGLRNENTGASVVLNNSIISGNESSLFPATNDVGGSVTNNFSLVGGSPAFVAPLDASTNAPTIAGDYRLADFSPAVDAGSNSLVPGLLTTDLDGNPRRRDDTGVADTGAGTAPIVDMGAYEKQSNSFVDPCLSISFPYTLPNNLAATLVTAIECANANGAAADTIDLNGQIVTLTAVYANYTGATGLPQVTTEIFLQNGTITRSGGAPQFRLLNVGASGNLSLDDITASGGSLSSLDNGGAIFNDGGTLNIRTSTVTNNSAGFGGALYNSGPAASMLLADSQFTNNSASQNGGLMMNDSGTVTISRSTVSGNSSSGTPGNGAIYNFQAALDIIDSTFSGNTATTSVGGVQNFGGTVRIANSVFAGNSASNNSSAVLNNALGVMTISNSRFTGNRVQNTGGAVVNNGSTLTVSNSTVAGNNAATGGGVYLTGGTATLSNSILWGNSGNLLTGASIAHSIIQGGFAGTGNLDVDPLFVAPVAFASAPTSTGNYHVLDHSPAIDSGNNAAVPLDTFDLNDDASTTDEAPDLDGNPRRYDDTGVADTGSGAAPVVDMGAFEKQTNSPPTFPMDVDYCNLQFPTSFTAAAGSSTPIIYGRIYEDDNGVLTSTAGAHPSIVAQVGHGPLGSDPRGGNPAWVWFPASFNVQVGNDDEYQGTFTAPFVPTNTQRSYTYRFSVDSGANYTYCDTDGNGTNGGLGFSTANLGTLTVNPGGQPTLSINDVSQSEGDSGTTAFVFTVSLNGPSLNAVTFDIASANNTATVANSDYVAISATGVTLAPGQTSTTFQVLVNGDTTFEPNETFFVDITNVVGAVVGDAQGTGTITNDDVDPCAAYTFPYTMTGNTPAELIAAINCANVNGMSADTIDLNGQTVALTASYASIFGTNIALPEITTPLTIRNGTITRSGTQLFRFLLNYSTLNLNNLVISNADSQGDGGAINNGPAAALTINSSRIIGNFGNFGGAIFNSQTATATLTNTLVSGNRSNSQGGGIRNRGILILNNSTVAANFTTSGAEGGGGIANAGSYSLTLNNSVVFGNEASNFPANNEMVGAFTSNNSLVGANPLFVAPLDAGDTAPTTGGDYRLAAFSPAIDAGDNSLIPVGVTTDLDGNPRRYNDAGVADTGAGSAPIVDIGAYERQTNSVLPQADLTITKTDGLTSIAAGSTATYTITVSNPGPDAAIGASVADTFPALCNSPSWTCVGAGGGSCTASGSGNIAQTVNLPVGGSVVYTALCPLSAAASGTLSNVATVATPGGVTDPTPANNSASDTTTVIAAPVLSINSVGVVETDAGGLNAVFTVTRTTSGTAFNVDYATADGTAVAGSDYTSTTGTLSFAADTTTTRTLNVPITGDLRVEGSESFTLSLSNPTGTASISSGTGTGTGTISDNDSATVQFAPLSLGQSEASSPMGFTVTLSNPVQSGVTLSVGTASGTATAADFTPISGATVSFPPDSTTSQTVNVTLNNDALDEDNEQYTLTLSGLSAVGNVSLPAGTATATGTIEDDDALPVLSVAGVSQPEGNSGTSLMTFSVNLTPVSGRDVSFTRTTVNGTATAPSDFVALTAGILTIPAGQTSLTIPVTINGDATFEGNESFTLALSGISNATPGALNATGTLEDDDQQFTTTSITSDLPDPSVVGQGYAVQVTVNGQSSSPLGNVTVDDGLGANCTAALVPGTAPASSMSCNLTSTSAGNRTLTATYAPASAAFTASTGTANHQVNPASTAISVSGPPRSRIGQPTSFSFALIVNAPGAGTPTGTVTLSNGSNSCQVNVPAATSACDLSFDNLGPRTVSAVFTPSNGNHLGSGSSGSGNAQTVVFALSDLAVSKTDAVVNYAEGELLVYTIQLRNLGPDRAANLRLRDIVPGGLVDARWSCDASNGAVCPATGGNGDIDALILSYPVGAVLNYSFFGNVEGNPDQILNIATLALPGDNTIEDSNLANNSASDLNLRNLLFADGFEAATVNAAAGSFVLPSAALRGVVDATARAVFALDDAQGQAARVYARVFDGRLQYALALRDSNGRLRLGAWLSHPAEPQLRWTAREQARGWVVQSVTLE